MQARRSAATGPKNDINVTPLVDVVLVLLIIFMVITPMLEKGAPAEVPRVAHPISATSSDDQVTITVDKNGDFFWEVESMSDVDLAQHLSAEYSRDRAKKIFVKGDVGAPYRRVRLVMKRIQEAGFTQVGLITKELKGNG